MSDEYISRNGVPLRDVEEVVERSRRMIWESRKLLRSTPDRHGPVVEPAKGDDGESDDRGRR